MKNIIKVGLTVFLICFGLSCTSEQIKKVGTADVDILPKVLATVAHAYGGPYASLIDDFFVSFSGGKSYQNESEGYQAKADYPELERPEDPSEDSNYDSEESAESNSQAEEYDQDQPPEKDYYDAEESAENYPQAEEYDQDQPPEKDYQDQPRMEYINTHPQKDSVSEGASLQVSIDLIKEEFKNGRYTAVPVADGDTLTQRDNYKVLFQSQTPC